MLIAQDRLAAPDRRNRPVGQTIATAVSVALHAAAIGSLLLRPGRALPPPLPPLEVEMVQQSAETRGAPPPPAAAPVPDTPPTPASPSSAPTPQPQPPQAQASAPAPPPSAPTSPSPRQTSPQRTAPQVHLGNSAQELDPLSVTGDNVVPPGPDARYRNMPPNYPAAAARIGAEGTVQLVARIAANGLPLSVGVAESSGNVDLDEEARRAVSRWRFRPALQGGQAVPYDYVINIRFALGDR